MHIDEQKKFDIRNIERNIKNGIITQKDYEIYLSKLPDLGDEIFNSEEEITEESRDIVPRKSIESEPKKKGIKRKTKGKGK